MRRSLAVLLILFFPYQSYARLGETPAELSARFGAPIQTGKEITPTQGRFIEFGETLTFRQGDWTVTCTVIDGRSAREKYSKPGDWTEDQFTTVLTSNAQGAKWTDVSKDMIKKLAREWHRTDSAQAVWQMGVGMTVTHPAFDLAKKNAEAKAKAEASKLPNI